MAEPRSLAQRRVDTDRILTDTEDVWVATAGDEPYLVPLTFAWTGEVIVFATPAEAITVRNLRASRRARLAFGALRDVVMMDVTLDQVAAFAEVPELHAAYVDARGIDPQTWGDDYVLVALRPDRVQAWREANEIADRTLMRDGEWLDPV